jgi:murein DD-endopeptidase MepM/ murein hydrolase activator NlpD
VGALFPEREVVLRTGSRRRRLAVSSNVQATVAVAAASAAIWHGIVTTKWLDGVATIEHKDHQIVELRVDRESAIASMKYFDSRFRGLAGQINSEMEEIERNLSLLASHDTMTSKPIADYTTVAGEAGEKRAVGELGQVLYAQLARLEDSLYELRAGHSEMLADSAETASAQLDRLEGALATVGVDTSTIAGGAVELCGGDADLSTADAGEGPSRSRLFLVTSAARDQRPNTLHATMRRWNDVTVAMSKLPLGAPLADRRMTSSFGRRLDPFHRRHAVHAGIDYVSSDNAPVMATGGGVVTYASRNGRYGNLVEIDHGQGFVTRYAHLADIAVTVGQEVERGTRVGTVGSTGRSTAPHLHYELRIGGQPSDPSNYIEVGKNVFKRDTQGGAG